jgi:hypothetical protein
MAGFSVGVLQRRRQLRSQAWRASVAEGETPAAMALGCLRRFVILVHACACLSYALAHALLLQRTAALRGERWSELCRLIGAHAYAPSCRRLLARPTR